MTAVTPTAPHAGAPLRRGDLTVYELDDEALIFDPKSSDTHRLNATALFIWRMCDGRNDRRRIAEALTQSYEVGPDAAHEHCERILDELWTHGLVTTEHDAK